jgi:serine/threonine protein kinase
VPIVPTVIGPGSTLGAYQLISRLAVGGMAEIFLARKEGEAGFARTVVVKRILPHLALNEELVEMFLDEARLVAQLHHQNIAQVYDFGIEAGSPYFAMEWVRGRDLREVMRAASASGGLPLEHALQIIVGVASGLHYAHEHLGPDRHAMRIVHRDVSPSNVLVTYEGGVKLVDFGVAKARTRQRDTGMLKGKVPYMSPEQCRGEEVDRRSDIFALGILLYETTTGTRLFRVQTEVQMLQAIVGRDAPPPSARVPGYPLALEAVVLKALRRDPAERYATAEALAQDVERVAAHTHIQLSPGALRRYMRELFADSIPRREPTLPRAPSEAEPPRTVMLEAELPEDLRTPIPFALPAPDEEPALEELAPALEPDADLSGGVLPTRAPVSATRRRRSHLPFVVVLAAAASGLAALILFRPVLCSREPV